VKFFHLLTEKISQDDETGVGEGESENGLMGVRLVLGRGGQVFEASLKAAERNQINSLAGWVEYDYSYQRVGIRGQSLLISI
jgi:hypothetical protein